MANKLNDYQNLLNTLQQFRDMSGNVPRETTLDDQGLGFIGRPIEEMEPAPVIEEPVIEAPQVMEVQQPEMNQPNFINDNLTVSPDIAKNQEEIQNMTMATPPSEKPEDKETKLQQILDQYRQARQQYGKDISEAAEKDRKAALIQSLGESLGKAVTYSGFAGGNVMSGPIPLDFKPIDFGYLKEAQLKGQSEIDSYRELLNAMRTNRALGNRTEIVNLGGETKMITYDSDGNIVKDQLIGKKTLTEAQEAQLNIEKMKEEGKNFRQAENLEIRNKSLELNKDKFDWQKVEKNELSEKQVDRISGMNTTLDSLDKIEGMKTFSTGPIKGRIESVKRFIGEADGNKTALAAQLRVILSQYGKSISGTAIAEPEMKRLELQLPQETDSDEQFAAKLANFKDEVENSRVRVLDDISKSGRDVEKFVKRESLGELKQKYQPGQDSNKVRVRTNDGKIGSIPRANLQKFLDKKLGTVAE